MTQTVRLDRLLANLGYGSRREVAAFVAGGRVVLRGGRVTRADQAVSLDDVRRGALTLDDEPLDPPAPLTVMLNKPAGYVCSHDERGAIIYDLLPPRWKGRKPALSAAGRLDKESTGQVILTDDGDLLHRIIHPKSHAAKQYAVTLARDLRGDEAALFATGTFVMRGDAKPLKAASWIPDGPRGGTMILHEGRFHQIRRMFQTLGNEVIALHRYRTGALSLGDLAPGEYRFLDEDDRQEIFASAGDSAAGER
jgi:16S rRNA pseudouridine516 synthase